MYNYRVLVVETVGLELVTHHPVIEPVSGQSRERNFAMQRHARNCRSFAQQRPNPETREGAKSPDSGAANAKTVIGV
jgi:hypothetical protein